MHERPCVVRSISVQSPFNRRMTSVFLKRSGVKRTVHGRFFGTYHMYSQKPTHVCTYPQEPTHVRTLRSQLKNPVKGVERNGATKHVKSGLSEACDASAKITYRIALIFISRVFNFANFVNLESFVK